MSQPSQIDLTLFPVQPDDRNVETLVRWLRDHAGWHHAQDILRAWGIIDTDQNRRFIRALASLSDGMILSGQRGYLHVKHATPEEIAHARNWLISQGREMIRRGLAITRAAHAQVG